MCRPITEVGAASPDESAASRTTHGDTKQSERELVVAGRSPAFPVSSCRWARTHVHTRGAGNHVRSVLCSPQLGPVRPDDSGTAIRGWVMLLRNPLRKNGRSLYVFHSLGPVCGNGKSLREPHIVCASWSSTTPEAGQKGNLCGHARPSFASMTMSRRFPFANSCWKRVGIAC